MAKAIVMTGAAHEATVMLEWVPGAAAAHVLAIICESGRPLEPLPWARLFDLSLQASGEGWTNAADLIVVARAGHFTSADCRGSASRSAPARRRVEHDRQPVICEQE